MYSVYDSTLQKELVTYYNSAGKKIKQFWYWNGDSNFHNVEIFYYSKRELISSLIDSFADRNLETTSYFYENNNLKDQITLDQNNDTCDFRSYPNEKTTIERWYRDGKPYRYDTTIFERENIKLEYYGLEISQNPDDFSRWHYKFFNQFDSNGNLVKVFFGGTSINSFTKYTYDNQNLLKTKQEVLTDRGKVTIRMNTNLFMSEILLTTNRIYASLADVLTMSCGDCFSNSSGLKELC